MMECIVKIADYASLQCKEVHSPGLTESKWGMKIAEVTKTTYDKHTIRLNSDRIFKKRYCVLLQHFSRIIPLIKEHLSKENSPKATIFWARTLVRIGFHEEALNVLPKLTVEMLPESPY